MTEKIKRKRKGNEGKKFEEDIKKSFEEYNLYCLRLKDSSSSFSNNSQSRFTSTNPCDFISYNIFNDQILYLECKSTEQISIPLKNFKEHQINEMFDVEQKFDYIKSFCIINFRKTENTYCLKIEDVYNYYYSLNNINIEKRKSITEKYCREEGILIESMKKRTRFKYNLYNLFYKIKEKEAQENEGEVLDII